MSTKTVTSEYVLIYIVQIRVSFTDLMLWVAVATRNVKLGGIQILEFHGVKNKP